MLPHMGSFRHTLIVIFLAACQQKSVADAAPKASERTAKRAVPGTVAQSLYAGAMQAGWEDWGWSPKSIGKGPVEADFSDFGGWILAKPSTENRYGGVQFRLAAPADSVEVRLEGKGPFPRVAADASHTLKTEGGFAHVFIPMSELNPQSKPFDQVVFQGKVKGPLKGVKIDDVALTAPVDGSAAFSAAGAAQPVSLKVDCSAPTKPISALIYGVAYDVQRPKDDAPHTYRVTARRWGGNYSSRYNWKLGNAWNAGSDWYFRNLEYTGIEGFTYDTFLDEQLDLGVKSALSIPMLGWVAKNTTSFAFPVEHFPRQEKTDPGLPEAGNGKRISGAAYEPLAPAITSVAAPPEFMGDWVKAIVAKDKVRGRSVHLYFLDNEPGLWHETHRDVHPEPLTYDELFEKTVAYARAIRKADPQAVIAGPCEWGWTAYFNAPSDTSFRGGSVLRPDRRKHGDIPLVPWYLKKLAEHEKKTGERLLDILDLHYYPQSRGLGIGSEGLTDDATNALRIRATRSLWDPTYKDESWVADTVKLIPRRREWVAENYPGLGLSIGEYNFGADTHPSGGLAQAEALGRFAQEGVTAAFVWYYPPKGSAGAQAFSAFRDYDGAGGHFLDQFVPSVAEKNVSLFASTDDAKKKLVLVMLNNDPKNAVQGTVDVSSCGTPSKQRVFQSTFSPAGFSALPSQDLAVAKLPPASVTVMEIDLEKKAP